ncbi:MAG TPA: T9SS type A sorting domain-containing protein [Bacteroidota bacterium]|nr:T9SS type A sorting domain-containing protein [Bacteroidota bacterium]
MKLSIALLTAILCLSALTTAVSQVTNLTVNGSTTNFTMASGDVIDWSFNIPVGATAECMIWLDINLNHAIDPGTDRGLLSFTQRDGDTIGNNGPPDMDGVADGDVSLTLGIGFAPGNYIMQFTHNGVGQSVWGVMNPLASPAFSVSGTVSGPVGADLSYIVIEATREGNAGVPFWHGLTDSLGDYTIEMGPDTAGNPWSIVINNVPPPYTVTRRDTQVTIDGHLTGIDFVLWEAAAQVVGRLIDDAGDTLEYASVYVSRIDSMGGGVGYGTQTDASGRFWIGIPLSDLTGRPWRIAQPFQGGQITTHMLASGLLPVLGDGDSVVHDLIAYTVNSSIQGFVQLDGAAPGFSIDLFASNQDSGESFIATDPVTGSFSIPVSDKIYDYDLWPMNFFGPYMWSLVSARPGDVGVIYNLTTVGVDDGELTLPQAYSLGQNYPNPFNPLTTIPYSVPERSEILLTVYDMLGREVATLVNEVQEPGMKTVTFDAGPLPSGVYAYRIVSKTFTDVKKMLVMK